MVFPHFDDSCHPAVIQLTGIFVNIFQMFVNICHCFSSQHLRTMTVLFVQWTSLSDSILKSDYSHDISQYCMKLYCPRLENSKLVDTQVSAIFWNFCWEKKRRQTVLSDRCTRSRRHFIFSLWVWRLVKFKTACRDAGIFLHITWWSILTQFCK